MRAREYWKIVTTDHANMLDSFFSILAANKTRFCVIGGQGVNAYVEPVVSLDLDIVIVAEDRLQLEEVLQKHFILERFAHSVKVSSAGSDLRIQIQTDPRYESFVARASTHEVLGVRMPVAAIEDVLDRVPQAIRTRLL